MHDLGLPSTTDVHKNKELTGTLLNFGILPERPPFCSSIPTASLPFRSGLLSCLRLRVVVLSSSWRNAS